MPRTRREPLELAIGRLWRAALDLCHADDDVHLARRLFATMLAKHEGGGDRICCKRWAPPDDFAELTTVDDDGTPESGGDAEFLDPLPQAEWCDGCKQFMDGPDYRDAMWRRRAAKARMKRAYKIINQSGSTTSACQLRPGTNRTS